MAVSLPIHGRGADSNPPNRFDPIDIKWDDQSDLDPAERPLPSTLYLRDSSRSIISSNDSPDVGIEASVNPYRGCEHGCVYCYARPTHEYFGLSAGLDFETKIFVKERAPELLRQELSRKSWDVRTISFSGVTDCYQPVERKLGLTRRCLEVMRDFRNPCGVITKSHLVTRDIDLLRDLAAMDLAVVMLSITTLDKELQRVLEPRASTPARRLTAVEAMANAGIPVGVMTAPVIPGLTDHELPALLKAAADAGAKFAGYTALRLPYALAGMFEQWLGHHFPDRKKKVVHRLREMRSGKLNDSRFGSRMRGEGLFADQLRAMFQLAKKRAGITGSFPALNRSHFRRPPQPDEQLDLWQAP